MSVLRPLGDTGLQCHPLGFGCYRIDDDQPAHAEALAAYLERGGNLIDTSANYLDGGSELLVGRVLRDCSRDRVIVVTKGGYIQGSNLKLARERDFPEVVRYADGLWHSIHPDFLETQVRLSAERLQVGYVDVYLLHNPEYYLTHIAHRHPPAAADHEEFYRRIREAFRFLEDQVQQGRIRWYGVSSNNYPLPAGDPVATSIERTLAAAESVSDRHHFRVVQLPLNLFESGGALEPNNDGGTPLDFCRRQGIGVLANRPLNAYFHDRLIRLADFLPPGADPPGEDELRALLAPLADHEKRLADLGFGSEGPTVAGTLMEIAPRLVSAAHWEQSAMPQLLRSIRAWLGLSSQDRAGRPEWESWQEQFVPLVTGAFQGLHRHLSARQQPVSDQARVELAQAGYPPSGESLSRLALNLLLGLEGLSCVLVGMRRPEYVEDAMGATGLERVDGREILKRFREGLECQPDEH